MSASGSPGVYACNFCLWFRTPNHNDVVAHWYNNTSTICSFPGCQARLPCRGIEKMHREVVHGYRNPEDTFHCVSCNCHFSSSVTLDWHLGDREAPPPKTKCASCPFVGRCVAATALHFAQYHA